MNRTFVNGGFCICLIIITTIVISPVPKVTPTIPGTIPFDHTLPVIRTKLPPTDIILRILPREEFERKHGKQIAGITDWDQRPGCVIEIPSDWVVRFVPSMGYAHFMDEDNSSTLAHEILHCVHGPWHPAWSVILAKEKEDAKGSSGVLTVVPNSGAR